MGELDLPSYGLADLICPLFFPSLTGVSFFAFQISPWTAVLFIDGNSIRSALVFRHGLLALRDKGPNKQLSILIPCSEAKQCTFYRSPMHLQKYDTWFHYLQSLVDLQWFVVVPSTARFQSNPTTSPTVANHRHTQTMFGNMLLTPSYAFHLYAMFGFSHLFLKPGGILLQYFAIDRTTCTIQLSTLAYNQGMQYQQKCVHTCEYGFFTPYRRLMVSNKVARVIGSVAPILAIAPG